MSMRNWSVDEAQLQKNPQAYEKWRLEQLINFGLNGEKLDLVRLRARMPELDIDPHRRAYLELLLNGQDID